jgi:septum site-determining protein MinC
MSSDAVTIKGIRDGLRVTLREGPLPVLVETLAERLSEQGEFFQGGRVALVVGERSLSTSELGELSALFLQHEMELWTVLSEDPATQEAARALELGTRLAGSGKELVGGEARLDSQPTLPGLPAPPPSEELGAEGLLVRGALRSGRVVTSQGHVAIIGDVNPGAEIVAGGDVIVWGKLRGLVHAGAFGDRRAVVCALEMIPTQLRIADLITVSPAGPRDADPIPEMASIKNGQIVAECWNPGYRGRR